MKCSQAAGETGKQEEPHQSEQRENERAVRGGVGRKAIVLERACRWPICRMTGRPRPARRHRHAGLVAKARSLDREPRQPGGPGGDGASMSRPPAGR